jgi:hypothetical protein
VVTQVLVQVCESQKELEQLLFLGQSVVAVAVREELDSEFSVHVQLVQGLRLNGMAFSAQSCRHLQLMHSAFQIVFQAQGILSERRRH